MDAAAIQSCTAFAGTHRLASGPVRDVARAVKAHFDTHPESQVLVFDNLRAQPVEFDLRGTVDDVLARLESAAPPPADAVDDEAQPRGRGRPKLGVIAREVTLLPRHWDWLAAQPGGASVTLRKLVEDARRAAEGVDRCRAAQEAAYRFMSAMAGNAAGFEDATRALFAADAERFQFLTEPWPADVRDFARELAHAVFYPGAPASSHASHPQQEVA